MGKEFSKRIDGANQRSNGIFRRGIENIRHRNLRTISSCRPEKSVVVIVNSERTEPAGVGEKEAKINALFESDARGNTFFADLSGMVVSAMRDSTKDTDIDAPDKSDAVNAVGYAKEQCQWVALREPVDTFTKGRALGIIDVANRHTFGRGRTGRRYRQILEEREPEKVLSKKKFLQSQEKEHAKVRQNGEPFSMIRKGAAEIDKQFEGITANEEGSFSAVAIFVDAAISLRDPAGSDLLDKKLKVMQCNLPGDHYSENRGRIQGMRDLLTAAISL